MERRVNIKIFDKDDKLVFDKTIFYPEGGGQPGDEGFITSGENKSRILGTKYINQKLVHLVDETQDFKENDKPLRSRLRRSRERLFVWSCCSSSSGSARRF